jgi:pimeloyl-ACP methyl ester carboxylesterase
MKRRALFTSGLLAALGPCAASAAPKRLESRELSLTELSLTGDPAFGRALLAAPREPLREPRLLVLLHGLGETTDQELGAHAFAERYGLLSAVQRLTHPPLSRGEPRHDYFGEGRLSELNLRLKQRPYRPPVLVCPFTPNPYKPGGNQVLTRFTRFVSQELRSAVEARLGVAFPPSRTMISGVSLGGFLAIEIFLRSPELYAGLGAVQAAFGADQAVRYAAEVTRACQRVGPRNVEILTSSLDPYRQSNRLLHRYLIERGQASRLRVAPGPHDQRWLNESGVIEMLLAADDVLGETL